MVTSTEKDALLWETLSSIEGKAEIVGGKIEMELPPGADVELAWEILGDIPGKAEIVNGRIILEMPTGKEPGVAALRIAFALHLYATRVGRGLAIGDNVTFYVDLPNRKSFSPDAAYTDEERDGSMRGIQSAPVFAVEVRSENDYGPASETAIRQKIADYFAAGTLAVWDVDLLGDNVVTLYQAPTLNDPQVFRRGEIADAGAALPGWTMAVDEIFA